MAVVVYLFSICNVNIDVNSPRVVYSKEVNGLTL